MWRYNKYYSNMLASVLSSTCTRIRAHTYTYTMRANELPPLLSTHIPDLASCNLSSNNGIWCLPTLLWDLNERTNNVPKGVSSANDMYGTLWVSTVCLSIVVTRGNFSSSSGMFTSPSCGVDRTQKSVFGWAIFTCLTNLNAWEGPTIWDCTNKSVIEVGVLCSCWKK